MIKAAIPTPALHKAKRRAVQAIKAKVVIKTGLLRMLMLTLTIRTVAPIRAKVNSRPTKISWTCPRFPCLLL